MPNERRALDAGTVAGLLCDIQEIWQSVPTIGWDGEFRYLAYNVFIH